jgi:hypothetical protein
MQTGVKISLCVNALKAIDLSEICKFAYDVTVHKSVKALGNTQWLQLAQSQTHYRKTFQLSNISSFLVEISKKPMVGYNCSVGKLCLLCLNLIKF